MSSDKKKVKVHIFFTSLIITILIFGTAMMLNYSLDFLRLGSILKVMQEHEISGEAFLTEESFIEKFGGNKCETMDTRVQLLKEKIKEVKEGIDVLTLTATPIPRTLHLALTGLRSLSMMETPPEERMAVKSMVTPFDEEVIREALKRERTREH